MAPAGQFRRKLYRPLPSDALRMHETSSSSNTSHSVLCRSKLESTGRSSLTALTPRSESQSVAPNGSSTPSNGSPRGPFLLFCAGPNAYNATDSVFSPRMAKLGAHSGCSTCQSHSRKLLEQISVIARQRSRSQTCDVLRRLARPAA